MKKFIMGFLTAALLFTALPIGAAIEEYICYKADYKVMVMGTEYTNKDLPILNYKGNTYAPFRSILEAAGLNVNWNAELGQAEVTTPNTKEDDTMSTNNNAISDIPKEIVVDDVSVLDVSEKSGIQVASYEGVEYVSIQELRDNGIYMAFSGRGKFSIFKSKDDMDNLTNPVLADVPYSMIRWGNAVDEHMVYVTYDYYLNTILPEFKE